MFSYVFKQKSVNFNLCNLSKPFTSPIRVTAFVASSPWCVKLSEDRIAVIVGCRSPDGDGKDEKDGCAVHGSAHEEQVSVWASIAGVFVQKSIIFKHVLCLAYIRSFLPMSGGHKSFQFASRTANCTCAEFSQHVLRIKARARLPSLASQEY